MPGGDAPDYPDMSPEQQQILSLVAGDLDLSSDLAREMLPYIFEEMGMEFRVTSPEGLTEADITANQLRTNLETELADLTARSSQEYRARHDPNIRDPRPYQDEIDAMTRELAAMPEHREETEFTYEINRLSEQEIFERKTPTEQKEILTSRAFLDQQLISLGTNPETMEAFTSDEERRTFLTPAQRETEDIQTAVRQQELKYLAGEGEVPLALERELGEFERVGTEETRRRLGSLDIASSAGIEAAGRREETSLIAREAARFGQFGQLEQIRGGMAAEQLGVQYGGLQQYGAISSLQAAGRGEQIGTYAGIPSMLTGGVGGAGTILQAYGQQQAGQYQAAYGGYQQQQQQYSDIATLAGMYAMRRP